MKKKSKILLVVSTLLILIAFTITPLNLNKVRVDSGFDSSYDSGGSYDSGSSYDYDYDYDRGSGSSSPVIVLMVLIFILICIISFTIDYIKLHKKPKIDNISDEEREIYNKITHNLDDDSFLKARCMDYKEVQEAWMNFDYKTLRTKLTDELYNQYKMQLDTLKIKNQKNIMEDFDFKAAKITRAYKENNEDMVEIYLYVEVYDYIEDKEKIVRGTNKRKMGLHYKITYTKKHGRKKINKCPCCGAEIKTQGTTQCEYCKSTITTDNTNWVMSKKEVLWQD